MSCARKTTHGLLFSSVDIGFHSITFAEALISLEVYRRIYHYKIPVKG